MDAALFSPLTLYYCADPVDQAFCDAFDRHLAPLKHRGLIQTWSDGQILAGQDLQEEGERHLSTDHLLLLLLSPDYLASELGLHQIEVALHRSEESRAVVMLILVRPCSW